MRKVLSLVLSALFLFSALTVIGTVSISAETAELEVGQVPENYKPAEGATPVGTVEEFVAMTADGNYYLTADLDLSAARPLATSADTPFTGTLDGAGHTLTVTKPLIYNFAGSAKNLVLKGKIDFSGLANATAAGALAMTVVGPATVENVRNEADVKTNSNAGGIIGTNTAEVMVKNCLNTGAVEAVNSTQTVEGETKEVKSPAGGICGYVGAVAHFEHCVNGGAVLATAQAGGVAGYSANVNVYFDNCTNLAAVTGANQTGGVAGYMPDRAVLHDCVNVGAVTSTGNYAGGIISRIGRDGYKTQKDADGNVLFAELVNCVNIGTVKSNKSQLGGIISYSTADLLIDGCINTADLVGVPASAEDTTVAAAGIGNIAGIAANVCAKKNCTSALKVYNCLNTGNLTGAAATIAGGIVGRAGVNGNKSWNKAGYEIAYCTNTGSITGGNQIGGIAGYGFGSDGQNQFYKLSFCVNTGAVIGNNAGAFLSQFIGYTNSILTGIQYCIGTGAMSVTGTKSVTTGTGEEAVTTEVPLTDADVYYCAAFGCSSAKYGEKLGEAATEATIAEIKAIIHDNYICDPDGKITWFTYATADKNAAQRLPATVAVVNGFGALVTLEDLAKGEIAYAINEKSQEMNGKIALYQRLGKQQVPTTLYDPYGVITKNEDGTLSTPRPPFTPEGGDRNVFLVPVLTLLLIGSAVTFVAVLPKKERN